MTVTTTQIISKVYRLAGGILAETDGAYYIVGELKEPCRFEDHGFAPPPESDGDDKAPYHRLKVVGKVNPDDSLYLTMETQGEDLAQLLHRRFIIHRNNSVSNRLWNAVIGEGGNGCIDTRWLEQMPDEVWDVVRDSLLRCL